MLCSISAALSGPAFVPSRIWSREGAQVHFLETAAGNQAYHSARAGNSGSSWLGARAGNGLMCLSLTCLFFRHVSGVFMAEILDRSERQQIVLLLAETSGAWEARQTGGKWNRTNYPNPVPPHLVRHGVSGTESITPSPFPHTLSDMGWAEQKAFPLPLPPTAWQAGVERNRKHFPLPLRPTAWQAGVEQNRKYSPYPFPSTPCQFCPARF